MSFAGHVQLGERGCISSALLCLMRGRLGKLCYLGPLGCLIFSAVILQRTWGVGSKRFEGQKMGGKENPKSLECP